jgi:hypothetical protein
MTAPKRRLLTLTLGVPAVALLLSGAASGQPADDGAVVQGTWTIDVKVQQASPSFEDVSGTWRYYFGDGCAVGQSCTITADDRGGDGGDTQLSATRQGFSFSDHIPLDCHDSVTGELTTPHGADYTMVGRLSPSATKVHDGVTYVTAMSGTLVETIKINAAGLATSCSVDGQGATSATQRSSLSGSPLRLPTVPKDAPPGAVGVDPASAASGGTLPEFVLPQSDTAADSARAVAQGDRSSVPGALTVPSDAIASVVDRLPGDLLLVALLGLLIVFPAQIFNSTYEENRERIERGFRRLRPRRAAVPASVDAPVAMPGDRSLDPQLEVLGVAAAVPVSETDADASRRVRRVGVFLLCALVGTLLGGLLDPRFGANRSTAALLVGVFSALLVAVLVVAAAGWLFRTVRHQPHHWYLRAIPTALVVAVVCVVVSRLTHFQPGYLFGLLGGAVFAGTLARRSEGRAEFVTLLSALVLALLAWVAFGPVVEAANETGASFGVLLADSFLGCLFIGGIEGLLFSLIPLRFLPGARVRQWGWVPWAALTLVTTYLFVHVLLVPESGYLGRSTTVSATVTVALFAAFGVLSCAFWCWFRFRPHPAEEPGRREEPTGHDISADAAGPVEAPVVMPT